MEQSVEEKIRDLKLTIEQHQRNQTRFELERDGATATLEQVREKLKNDFQVESSEDARTMLTDLDNQLAQDLSVAYALVEKING